MALSCDINSRGAPMTVTIALVAFVALLLATVSAAAIGRPPSASLTLQDYASQMSQYDIQSMLKPDGSQEVDTDVLTMLLQQIEVGSLFNSPSSNVGHVPTTDEWRFMQETIYNLSTTMGSEIPVLFGLDSVHGANYVFNATLFPQQIGTAATFNTTVAYEAGRITGLETRYAGIPWVFSPILGIAVQPSWARVFETFGEDPVVAGNMGVNIIQGLQRPPPPEMNLPPGVNHTVAACMKHFIGYTNIRTGHDRTPVFLPMNILLQYFAAPFKRAIDEANVLSVMENYIELNGRPVVASELILQFLLRTEMGFDGMLVTDYNEIFNLADFHMAAGSYQDALQMSLNATSIDMAMVGNYSAFPLVADAIQTLINERQLDGARIATSGEQVIALKEAVGLFAGSPVPQPTGCVFACESHRATALDAARQSIVLLQNNDNFLPLETMPPRVAVVGQACDSVPLMAGGWTIHWQGTDNRSAFPYGQTFFEAIGARFPSTNFTFHEACNVTENSVCDPVALAQAVAAAAASDLVFVCVGERHYAEKPGDIDDLTLPGQQIPMVQQIYGANPNIVLILVEGRPRVLQNLPLLSRAVINAMLPGPSGGEALVDIITGRVNPSGRQPITYPLTLNNAPIQYWRKYSANTGNDYAVQWPFGHGLSYTTFAYSNLKSMLDLQTGKYLTEVTVSNTGTREGSTAVLLFSTQVPRALTPEVQILRNFTKVFLAPGANITVMLPFSFTDAAVYDEYNCLTLQRGDLLLSVGNATTTVPVPIDYHFPCATWGDWWASHTKGASIPSNSPVPAAPPQPKSATSEYVISSVVCFGAGIAGTVIVISYMRRRQGGLDVSAKDAAASREGLLEPTAV